MTSGDRVGRPTTPPSFSPSSAAARPAASDDAVVVGSAKGPAREARPSAPAPSTPPRGTPTRPASYAPAGAGARPQREGAARVGSSPSTPRPVSRPASPAASRGTASGGRPASVPPRRTTPSRPAAAAARPAAPTGPAPARRRRRRLVVTAIAVVLVVAIAWPVGLAVWANGKVQHTPALSGAAGTPGTTYLLTGSDSRADGAIEDTTTEGARTDTILLLQVPENGPTALISLPRDTYVQVPGHGAAKLNAAFAWGGAPLLVQTVEQLTGMTVDHYVEIGMGGVEHVVDAVGGVNLCWDADVNDADSGMVWTAGCHDVDGVQALAFSRMRKSDPTGDIGRAQRQRQVIQAVMGKVQPSSLVWHPSQQVQLVDAGTAALTVSEGSSIVDLGRLALAFRAANGPGGITGTPPITSLDYRPGKIGSTVLLDPDTTPAFFVAIRDGKLPAGQVGGIPQG